jgi:hypothetical protein
MDAIDIYKALSVPPKSALKPITGGRLKGMTDIRPQWRYRAMTEQFGLCGVGWRYTIERTWTEAASTELMAFVTVNLYVKVDGAWSDAIPGTGGSMLIAKESSGPHASDEAYKMATTDALSVAMKMIGVGAAIYEGEDVSKYHRDEQTRQQPPRETKPEPKHEVKDPPKSDVLKKAAETYRAALTRFRDAAPEEVYEVWRARGNAAREEGDAAGLRSMAAQLDTMMANDEVAG